MKNESDNNWIQQSILLATQSVAQGGGPFGAVIVKNKTIIGQGNNQVTLNNDPTAHAEIIAIRQACNTLNDFNLEGCTLYSSCEPCPMCLSAIYWARISRVVYAASANDAAQAGFDDAYIAREICLPHTDKSLPIEQCHCENRNQSFIDWQNKTNKIIY